VGAVTAKPRVFVTQPIASSALERLRALANVKINMDSSKIIAKSKLIAAVKKCDILISLLHDRIDRAVLAADLDRPQARFGRCRDAGADDSARTHQSPQHCHHGAP